jgi:hypothetical protein
MACETVKIDERPASLSKDYREARAKFGMTLSQL